jgi:hypothetical protein
MGTLFLTSLRIEWDLSDAFWAGLCAVVTCLQLYHFFQPIDILIAELVGVLGLSGVAYNRIAIVKALRQGIRIGFWPAMCYIVAVLTIAARCAGQVVHYDTGFYGDTVVRWFTTYPLVPGLTNLHRQIGLNSNVFLCVALLNQAPLPNLGFHLFVGMLLCILFVHIVKSFLHLFFGQDQSILDYFIVLLVIPCIFWVLNGDLVGTNTDLPTSVVSIAGLISLLGALQDMHKTQMSSKRIESRLLVASMLFALGVTFKVSSLAIAVLGWVIVLVQLSLLAIPPRRKRIFIIVSMGLSSALVMPWILRGVVLSGYPFYPSSAFGLPVDWRVPTLDTDLMARTSRAWARIPHVGFGETSGVRWLKPWLAAAINDRVNFVIPVALSLLGVILLLRRKTPRDLFWLWLLLPSLSGLLFWFLAAPSFRFGEAAIWTTAACLGVIPLQYALSTMSRSVTRLSLLALVALAGWCSHPRTIWRVSFKPLLDLHEFMEMPNALTAPYLLGSGLTVQVPIETNQCWEAKLPCSPYFADNLKLRRDANLRWGFRIDPSEVSLNYDKFTPLHRRYVAAKPTEPICLNCHLQSK